MWAVGGRLARAVGGWRLGGKAAGVWRLDLEIAPHAEVGERARHLCMTETSGASLC
jgi:hypothetical protein